MHAPLFGAVHGFMVQNLFLAAVPVALAVLLFRPGIRRPAYWWVALGAWILFLPNAPYVLTDVTHLVDDLRDAPKPHAYVVLATYGAFFTLGLAAYAFSLQRFRKFLHRTMAPRLIAPTLLALHGLCVIAMYLGRVRRLNSWDAVLAPASVVGAFARTPRPATVVALAVTFVVVGVATYVTKIVGDTAWLRVRRLR